MLPETLAEHLLTQRAFTYFFVGAVAVLGLLSLTMLFILARQGQLLKSMLRKCEKMQKQIGLNAVAVGQILKSQEIEQRQGGNRNSNKNTLKVSKEDAGADLSWNALMRLQDTIDAQRQEIQDLKAKSQGDGLKQA